MTRFSQPETDPNLERADAILRIDLNALRSNYALLRDRAAPAECAACVKADAYGLGVTHIAPALMDAGCKTFFVAHADEGAEVRRLLAEARIYILHGVWPGSEEILYDHRLTPVLNSLQQLDAWGAIARAKGTRLDAALHVDTGMTRLGLGDGEIGELTAAPGRLDGVSLTQIMSHLCCGDEPANPLNATQLQRFNEARARLPAAPASLAASGGIFLGSEYHFDMVRAGIALYGARPTSDDTNPMSEVTRASARILQVRDVDSPLTVGYGAAHKVDKPSRIATISVGYADGYILSLSGRGYACIDGIAAPVVGRVSMDLITLDVSDIPRDKAVPGAFVDIIGGGPDLDDVARLAGTISYELLTRLGRRFHRVYQGEAS
jgi:alanine racemase